MAMRIRSIRPEFWASRDIAALDWHHRLVYIGLWQYVDDNGVGRDEVELIQAALFPFDDVSEASLRIQGALRALSAGGQITQYRVQGKPYLHVVAFLTHQLINRPSKGRYPLPTCGDAELQPLLSEPSVTYPAHVAPREGEKGRRGEGEKKDDEAGASSAPSSEVVVVHANGVTQPEATMTTQTIVGQWIDHCQERPPSRVIGQVSKEVKNLLDEDKSPELVLRALAEWNRKGLHPSTISSVFHEISNRGPAVSRRQQETDDQAQRWLQRATASTGRSA
jgi:hypothetical protein